MRVIPENFDVESVLFHLVMKLVLHFMGMH